MRRSDQYCVIIPAYNASLTIENTLKSVLEQSYKATRIIVIDDASTDCTADIIKKFPIEVITNKVNIGSGESRNKGLREISDGVIAIIDADDTWDHDYGERMMQLWAEAPENTGAIGMLLRPVGDISSNGFIRQNRRMTARGLSAISPITLAWHNPFYASATSFDIEKIRMIGGWGKKPHSYSEDYSLLARLMVEGFTLVLNPVECGNYLLSSTQKSASIQLQFQAEIFVSTFILSSERINKTLKILVLRRVMKLGIWLRAIFRSVDYGNNDLPRLNYACESGVSRVIDFLLANGAARKTVGLLVRVIGFLRS